MKQEQIKIPRVEYEDILDYMERLRETVAVLSNQETVKKLNNALNRMETGEFLTKKDMVFEDA